MQNSWGLSLHCYLRLHFPPNLQRWGVEELRCLTATLCLWPNLRVGPGAYWLALYFLGLARLVSETVLNRTKSPPRLRQFRQPKLSILKVRCLMITISADI